MRSGGYLTYLLLSEHVKLSEAVQKELREAVFRGEGLVEAGSHDQRQGRIDDALGIKFKGKHSHMGGVLLPDSVLREDPGQMDFRLDDKPLRAESEGAEIVGRYLDAGSGLTDELAVSVYGYGEGKSVYAGFDLLAEATLAGLNSEAGQLVLDALDYAHPAPPLIPRVGGAFPVRLTLTNEGIATPGRVVLPLPEEITVVDPGTGQVDTAHRLIWPFDLAEQEVVTLHAWLVPTGQPLTLDATVQVGTEPELVDHASLSLTLDPAPLATPADALAFVEALDDNKTYKQIVKDLGRAQDDWEAARFERALKHLRKAADRLLRIETPEADQARLLTAQAIRHVALQL